MSAKAITKVQAAIVLILIITAGATGLYLTTIPTQPAGTSVSYPLTFSDDLGRNVTLSKAPERIVSLVPSATEIVFAVGAGDKVVGVTRYDVYPPELVDKVKAGAIVSVGGGFDPDIEKITALKPDVILVDGPAHVGSKPLTKLKELGFTIFALNANSIEGVLKDIGLVGKIVGNTAQADKVMATMNGKINFVVSKTSNAPKVKVYIENWPDPLFSVGPGYLQNEMVEKSGGINIFFDLTGSGQVNAEAVIERNPDVIIMFHNQTSIDDLKNRPGWDQINAVKNNKVFQMTGYEGAPNPRVADSLQKMAKFIHPELFQGGQSTQQAIFSPQLLILLAAVIVSRDPGRKNGA